MEKIIYTIIGFGALIGALAIFILEIIIVGLIHFIKWLKNRKEK